MTTRSLLRTLCIVALACVTTPAHPATQRFVQRPGATAPEAVGGSLTFAAGPGGRLVTRAVDATGPLRLLIALDAPPAALARLRGGDPAASARVADRLRADLASITGPRGGAAARVTRVFTQVWSGAAVSLDPALLERVRTLPYVRGVFLDDSVRALLDQSVPLIRADRVRNELGVDGTGIRIGIVDTGIDYTHPAFGSGFGPGHRVAGGYDFVHDDADPMDDAGHGTHVAGIAAGNGGGVVGVAPGATLYAFKVLDANGYGFESWILAGLDRALDPDGNPATPDAVQVINLSLGGEGNPDDPMSTAIDHLSELGVTCCVAAGNAGWYFTIGSPGCARSAITVGASTREDTVAYFSSFGPVASSLDLKPDLVAPGEGIVSAALGGNRVAMSGTSMATPHVAGVAALLRQLHPAWSAEALKSALIATARDLGIRPFRQGAGRLDAWNAAHATFALAPTHLSFGRVDWDAAHWQQSAVIQITNLTGAPRTVSLPDSLRMTAGALLTISPSQVVVAPGSSAPVLVTLAVENDQVEAPHDAPYGYSATIPVTAAGDTQRVPVSFHKTTELRISSSGLIEWLIVHDRTENGYVFSNQPSGSLFLPPGTYDVMASFYPRWKFVVRENVVVSRTTDLTIDPEDATHHLVLSGIGPDGAPLAANASTVRLGDQHSLWRFFYSGFPLQDMWVSDLSDAYQLDWFQAESNFRDRRISVTGSVQGLHEDRTFTNTPSDLRHVAVELPRTLRRALLLEWVYSDDPLLHGFIGFGSAGPFEGLSDTAFTYHHWWVPSSSTNALQAGLALDLYAPLDDIPVLAVPVLHGPRIRLDRGWPLPVYYLSFYGVQWLEFAGRRMELGGLPLWRGQFHNGGEWLALDGGFDLNPPHLTTDMYGSLMLEPDEAFTLSQNGTVVLADTLRGSGQFSEPFGPIFTHVPVLAPTVFHTWRDYTIGGAAARLDVRTTIQLLHSEADPPWLNRMQLFANGEVSDTLPVAPGTDAELRFRIVDANPFTVQALVRPKGLSWIALSPDSLGDGEYLARFPSTLRGPVALRLVAEDLDGNQLDLTWDAAFIATGSLTPPPPGTAQLAIAGARPNPAASSGFNVALTLPTAAPARLTLHDVTGREILRRDVGALGPGDHQVWVQPNGPLRPGLYFLRLTGSGREVNARVCLLR